MSEPPRMDELVKACGNFFGTDPAVFEDNNIIVSTSKYSRGPFIQKADAKKISDKGPVFFGMYKDKPIVYVGMPGSPSHAAINFYLLRAMEPKRVVYAGWAGCLNGGFKFGDVFYVEEAVSLEGIMHNYGVERGSRLSPGKNMLRVVSEKTGLGAGKVVTVSDRTWEFNPEFRKEIMSYGADGVEMETAVLYAMFPSNSIAVHLVSDEPNGSISFNHENRDKRLQALSGGHIDHCLDLF